jgi:hypothetical protein
VGIKPTASIEKFYHKYTAYESIMWKLLSNINKQSMLIFGILVHLKMTAP